MGEWELIRRDQMNSMERGAAEAAGIDCEVIGVRGLNPWGEPLVFGPAAEGCGPVLRIGGYDPEHLGSPGPFHVLSRIQQTP